MAKIRNKLTGEIKEIPDEQLANYGISQPQLMSVDNAIATPPPKATITPQAGLPINQATQADEPLKTITGRTIEEHAKALSKAKMANNTVAIKQITDDYNREYSYQKDTGLLEKKQKTSAAEEKIISAKGKATNILSLFEDLYYKSGQTGLASGRLGGFAAGASQAIGYNEPLNTYKRTLESKRAILAKAAGDAGNLALQEQILAGRGLPDEFSTPSEAQNLFRATRGGFELSESTKPQVTKDVQDPHIISGIVQGVIDAAIRAKDTFADIGAGAARNAEPGAQQAQQDTINAAQAAYEKAQQVTDPEQKARLLKVAQMGLNQVGINAKELSGVFSKDVQTNPWLRGLDTAATIVLGADVLANPASMIKGVTQPIRHPIQTTKNVTSAIRHPIEAGKTFIKSDWKATKAGWNPLNQPVKGAPLADGSSALAEKATARQVVSEAPGVNDFTFRDKLAKEFSTSIAVTNEGSVLKAEKNMQDAFRMTTSPDPRGVARELETLLPQYTKATKDYAIKLDQTIGGQPLDEVVAQVMEKVKNTTAARANPRLAQELEGQIRRQLQVEGAGTAETSFSKMNDTRIYLNSGKTSWFSNRQPVGTPTNDLNALDWEASKELQRIMAEGDKSGIFKDLIAKQHTALQVIPVLSKEVLTSKTPSHFGGLVKRGYDTVRNRIILKNVPRGQGGAPEITLADGSPAIAEESALMNKAGVPLVRPDESAPSTLVGEKAASRKITFPKPEESTYNPFSKVENLKREAQKYASDIANIEGKGSDATGKLFERDLPGLRKILEQKKQQIAELQKLGKKK